MAAAGAADAKAVTKRLQQELMGLARARVPGVSAFPEGENILSWIGTIKGTVGTPYEGMQFKLSLKFPATYPFAPPAVKFETACFHPNVDAHGNICLDILKENWSSAYGVQQVLLSVQSLLGDPNNDSPLNVQAANLWPNRKEFAQVLAVKYSESRRM
eukprot:TRINITY_DN10551_c2_g1_i1.p2 TRINITY_DN10551_c2_g1~~TRINITY_DN10551_c2_g1_i1.p2  ORF type:complete len:175 (+),score=57.10 TRINITY_DN10551_c2_g1_i1:52-525(+)